LVTGFEPFDGDALNPSWLIARSLHGLDLGGVRVQAEQLPCAFDQAGPALQAALRRHRPRLVLALGQAATALSLLAWLYLLFLHGRFWKADQRLPPWRADRPPPITDWPRVVAVVPARNEADVIGAAVGALLALDYPGGVPVVLVDDGSTDGTADAARAAAATLGAQAAARLVVLTGAARPPGWAGKVWAMAQGIAEAERLHPAATHLLLTDADIAHDPANLRELAVKAMGGGPDGRRHVLVSLMVMLKADG
ncbi:MAG: glycosyltransferase, partial [Phycisphaerales bacterium]|nr:glycosyltransferase [Phycisphaerales bacterium]